MSKDTLDPAFMVLSLPAPGPEIFMLYDAAEAEVATAVSRRHRTISVFFIRTLPLSL